MSQNPVPKSSSPVGGGAAIVKVPVGTAAQIDPKVSRAKAVMEKHTAGGAAEANAAQQALPTKEVKGPKLDKMLQGHKSTDKEVSASVAFSETLPKVNKEGRIEGNSLIGVMDGVLRAASRGGTVGGGVDAKTIALLEGAIRATGAQGGVKFKNADGSPAHLDSNGARNLVRTLEMMAKGKYAGVPLTAESLVALLPSLFGLRPQRSPAYKQLVAFLIQDLTGRPSSAGSPQQVKSDLYADMKAYLGPLLRYDAFDTGPVTLDAGKDSFQAPQLEVLHSLRGWYTTLQIYAHANLSGTDSALIGRVLKSIESKITSLRAYAGPSDANGTSFSHVTGFNTPPLVVLPS